MDIPLLLTEALAGRYLLEREIGAGGMATVFRARDVRHDRLVAIKVFRAELGEVLGAERFLAEIKVTATLQHPNLVPLFDSGEAGGHLYYVMPFIEGESLRARLDRERQLPVDEAVRLSVAISEALEYAHNHGVIHRDLKPENILLQAGQPVVADFGIALAVSKASGMRVTEAGLSLGTPQYMSPEQATGDRMIDGRTDVYSLGAVTYEMLCGEPPYCGESAQTITTRLLTEEPRGVRSARPTVPLHVEYAIARALAKLPADRWSTAHEFAEALRGKKIFSETHPVPSQLRPRLRGEMSNPFVIALAAVTVIGTTVAGWRLSGSQETATPSTERFLVAPTREVNLPVTQGASVSISPDGGTVAFVARKGVVRNQMFVRRLSDLDPMALPGTEGAGAPFFSPDGEWLGFMSNQKLRRVSMINGAVVDITDVGGLPTGLTWITPDTMVLSLASDLLIQPADGGPRVTLPRLPGESSREWPRAVGDGEHVLYASWQEAGGLANVRIGIASVRTRESKILDVTGVCPLGVIDGILVYVTAGQDVMAVPFDARAMRVKGDPAPVERGVLLGGRGSCKAAVSREGTLALQRGWPLAQLVLRDALGNERVLLDELKPFAHPRFSPDGKRIAITIASGPRTDVWIYDLTGGTLSRLTEGGSVNERPEWTPDGTRVLFRSDQGPHSGIWWRPADRSEMATPLLLDERADIFEAVLTPDGKGVVYQVDTIGADVMYRRFRDSVTAAIAATEFPEDRARVSPDGKWVALTSFVTGVPQVVVYPLDRPGGQVQVSTDNGTEPVWSRTGNRLYYRDGSRIMAASWVASPHFRVTSRAALFDDDYLVTPQPHAGYDVSPDGSQFLLLKMVESSEVVVVKNLLAQLRAGGAAERKQ